VRVDDATREDQARELAAALGLQLVKSPSTDLADDQCGLYVLVKHAEHAEEAFDDHCGMTLEDVERALKLTHN